MDNAAKVLEHYYGARVTDDHVAQKSPLHPRTAHGSMGSYDKTALMGIRRRASAALERNRHRLQAVLAVPSVDTTPEPATERRDCFAIAR